MRSKLSIAALAFAASCTLVHAQTPAAPAPAATAAKPAPAPATPPKPVSPAKAAKVEEMLNVTKIEPSLQQMTTQMQSRIKQIAQQQAAQAGNEPEKQPVTTTYLAKMDNIAATEVTWDKLKPAIIQSYADSFSDSDLDSILAFYKTPAGKALLDKQPELSDKTRDAVQKMVGEAQPQMMQATKDYQDKIKTLTKPTLNTLPDSTTTPKSTTTTPAKPATDPAAAPKK